MKRCEDCEYLYKGDGIVVRALCYNGTQYLKRCRCEEWSSNCYTHPDKPACVNFKRKTPEPKPCPICGSNGAALYERKWVSSCANQHCGLMGPTCDTQDQAIAEWNKLEYSNG